MQNMRKVYVRVLAEYDKEGNIFPRSMTWETDEGDSEDFEIDRVLAVEPRASLKAGGQGMRYKVKIRGRERYLWLEEDLGKTRWFVEAPAIEEE